VSNLQLFGAGIVMIVLELIYFTLARKFAIVDRPNERTLHLNPTIRGGGVIFFFAPWIYYLLSFDISLRFLLGLTLVSVAGFIDDVVNLKSGIRLTIQVLALTMMFYDIGYFNTFNVLALVLLIIAATAALNAYNFMDGINGITAGYSLVVIGTLLYFNQAFHQFIANDFLLLVLGSLMVFSFFNFRTHAKCFAGDVGSTTMAFILIYCIMTLVFATGNYIFIMLLAVYGVDSALTIAHRLMRRENIFKAHRFHLYQVIVHHFKVPHLVMSALYMIIQLAINWIVINNLNNPIGFQYMVGASMLAALAAGYILLKSFLLVRIRV
jgi:UDP-GlcNAc:undecaprenyl-phosphate GlcNAc-1-phosphate transferase